MTKFVQIGALFLIFVLKFTEATNKKCQKICGQFDETKNAREKILAHKGGQMVSKDGSFEKESEEEDPIKMRIIHGYEPPLRGFMVKIKAGFILQHPAKKPKQTICHFSMVNYRNMYYG